MRDKDLTLGGDRHGTLGGPRRRQGGRQLREHAGAGNLRRRKPAPGIRPRLNSHDHRGPPGRGAVSEQHGAALNADGSRLDDSQHQYDRQAPPAPRGQLRGSHCPRPEITHFRVFSAFAPWESPASRAPCGPTTRASRASPARISVIRQGRVESRPRNPRCQAALARQSQANSK